MLRELVTGHVVESVRALLRDPAVIAKVEKRVRKLLAQRAEAPAVDAKRIRQLRKKVANLTDATASGMLRKSPALASRLEKAEEKLSRLERATRPARSYALLRSYPSGFRR